MPIKKIISIAIGDHYLSSGAKAVIDGGSIITFTCLSAQDFSLIFNEVERHRCFRDDLIVTVCYVDSLSLITVSGNAVVNTPSTFSNPVLELNIEDIKTINKKHLPPLEFNSKNSNEVIANEFINSDEMKAKLNEAFSTIVSISHALASKSGWWDLPQSVVDAKKVMGLFDSGEVTLTKEAYNAIKAQADWKPNIAEKLCLIHSEVSEAMEGDRKNLFDDHLTDRPMIAVELVDGVLRIADLAGYLKLDLGSIAVEKLVYNQQRADHKRENRSKEEGKKY